MSLRNILPEQQYTLVHLIGTFCMTSMGNDFVKLANTN